MKPQGQESTVDVIDWPCELTKQDFPSPRYWIICTLLARSSWSLMKPKAYGVKKIPHVLSKCWTWIVHWYLSFHGYFKCSVISFHSQCVLNTSWDLEKNGVIPEYLEITDFSFWLMLSTLLLVRFMKLQVAFFTPSTHSWRMLCQLPQNIRQLSAE